MLQFLARCWAAVTCAGLGDILETHAGTRPTSGRCPPARATAAAAGRSTAAHTTPAHRWRAWHGAARGRAVRETTPCAHTHQQPGPARDGASAPASHVM